MLGEKSKRTLWFHPKNPKIRLDAKIDKKYCLRIF